MIIFAHQHDTPCLSGRCLGMLEISQTRKRRLLHKHVFSCRKSLKGEGQMQEWGYRNNNSVNRRVVYSRLVIPVTFETTVQLAILTSPVDVPACIA